MDGAGDDGWTAAWQPLIDRVGEDLDGPGVRFGPDRVETGAVRRYAELLELDCVLHRDEEAARAHGLPGIVAPYSSAWSWTFDPAWVPGDPPAYPDADRDAQPRRSAMAAETLPSAPPTSHIFATEMSYEFARPIAVGERVGVTGRRLVACIPKRTSVGRGAFVTVTRRLVAEDLDTVCRVQLEMYLYDPYPTGS
jgi:N-terminal half of MaoC dehydratase